MAYDPQTENNSADKKSIFGVIVHSFFVIPFLLAIFSVLLFVSVRILTMEKHSVNDYLQDINTGGLTKRWQAAFELSRILSNPTTTPHDDKFISSMKLAFEKSKNDDDRVRQYLALAMGRSGIQEFADVLIAAVPNEKDENLYAIISGLGILQTNKATPVLLDILNSENVHLRLAAVVALGNISDPQTIGPLQKMLNDPEVNVQWDAAVALAKMGDRSGRGILINLMDRKYLESFKNLTPQSQSHMMTVAIQTTANWQDSEIKNILKELFISDRNMNVRSLAHKVLQNN